MEEKTLLKKITAGIIVFIVLCMCLGVTSFALIYAMVTVEDNVFTTGFIDINLNDGEAVIYDPELYFEPGMTVTKEFFVENTGSAPLYYKLYLSNVHGELVEHINITITDGQTKLYSGTALELSRTIVNSVEKELEPGEKRTLQITLYMSTDAPDEVQGSSLGFDLCADAVQSENNTDREFTE